MLKWYNLVKEWKELIDMKTQDKRNIYDLEKTEKSLKKLSENKSFQELMKQLSDK